MCVAGRGGRLVALAGASAGAVIALRCVSGIGFDVSEYVRWHLVPAGAVHGSALAWTAWTVACWVRGQGAVVALAAMLCAGWVGGYAASMPLIASLNHTWAVFDNDLRLDHWWDPYRFFGAIVVLHGVWLALASRDSGPLTHVIAASSSGVSGYLVFWQTPFGYWSWSQAAARAALLDGVTWGVFVGAATAHVWHSVRPPASPAPQAPSTLGSSP
jgi:hypothetical protein